MVFEGKWLFGQRCTILSRDSRVTDTLVTTSKTEGECDGNIYKSNIKMIKYTSLDSRKDILMFFPMEKKEASAAGLVTIPKWGFTGSDLKGRGLVSEVRLDHRLCLQLISVEPKKAWHEFGDSFVAAKSHFLKQNLFLSCSFRDLKVPRREARPQIVLSCITNAF